MVEQKRKENMNLTRSEILAIQRSIDLKLQIEDKMKERDDAIQENVIRDAEMYIVHIQISSYY